MADKKLPGVQTQKQEKESPKTPEDKDWFYGEQQQRFNPLVSLSFRKKLQLQLSNNLLDVRGRLQASLGREFETGLGFNLLPVFFGIGVLIYFTTPAEPALLALIITPAVLLFALWRVQVHGVLYQFFSAVAVVVCGMLIAKAVTVYNPSPMLERQLTATMVATVINIDQNRRGAPRYLLKPHELEGLSTEQMPHRLRVSSSAKNNIIKPGDMISGLVRLQPVSGPVYPSGYDFSFFSWYEGLGGSGFFMGKPQKVTEITSLGYRDRFAVYINNFRLDIENRIVRAIPGRAGDVAVALVTGNKTRIPADVQESLRKTGLAHILAISGLHMALVTLTVIWFIRFVVSLSPAIALKYPVKKWAVCAGFFCATTYLLLSGASVATQRAWVMISVMLLAILMDRRAITMRSVAISALIILLLNPQSLLSPGFQMSFAAVTALVAGYEILNQRRRLQSENIFQVTTRYWIFDAGSGLVKYFGAIATTSLIAGTATAFIAAWHFHQVAPLGLLANLLTMPIVTLLIMPLVLLSVLLMPYGLEFIALVPVSHGIEWVIGLSAWVESLSPSGNTGMLPRNLLLLFASFLIIAGLFKTRLRSLGFLPLIVIPFVYESSRIPDVIISENGRAVAIKTKEEKLGLLFPRGSKFVQQIWLKAWSKGEPERLDLSKDQCNRERCIIVLPTGKVLHVLYNPDFIRSSCQRADILVAPRLWWVNCYDRKPELVLNRYDFERFGTHALYINKVTTNAATDSRKIPKPLILVETAIPQPSRPWHRVVRHPDDISDIGVSNQQVSPEPSPGQK